MKPSLRILNFPHNIRIIDFLFQSYSYIMSKVWYYQIWIQNYLGFIVSDLKFILEKEGVLLPDILSLLSLDMF